MQHSAPKLKVVIVDDDFLYPIALDAIISKSKCLETSAILSSGEELIDRLDDLKPDIVFMDILMPGMNGFETTAKVKQKRPDTKVIAITAFDNGENVQKMMEAGAWGYITKDSDKREYDELFARIADDKKYICSKAAINYSLFISEGSHNPKNKKDLQSPKKTEVSITKREGEVIQYIAKGLSDKETAKALHVSHRTIDAHKQNIMQKFGTRKSAEIVAIAYRLGII